MTKHVTKYGVPDLSVEDALAIAEQYPGNPPGFPAAAKVLAVEVRQLRARITELETAAREAMYISRADCTEYGTEAAELLEAALSARR